MASLPADYAGYQLTKKDAGGDDTKDSDADPATTCTPPTTLGADKREDLTLDAGIVSPPNRLGDYVWVDKNKRSEERRVGKECRGVRVPLETGEGKMVTNTTTEVKEK